MTYIPVIGLEIHAEMLTKSKVFCGCANEFGGMPNSRVCPRCSGMPGTLPIINREAVTLAVRAGLALNCEINRYSAFDRKNYFYPDLPKAYQITQFEFPICTDGSLLIDGRTIRINRIHIEEDAGKLIHDDYEDISMADYNRCGVPLIEIVTEPDFRKVEEVQHFVEEVALRLKYAQVCDGRLEQGSLRVDVNISIMPLEAAAFGTRVEIKNLNSIKSIGKAIEYEISRQAEVLDQGGKVLQETRRFNDSNGETKPLRSKDDAHDYRYFPEPDIPPVVLQEKDVEEIRRSMPEMPGERVERYTKEYALSLDDAKLIAADKAFSDFYDAAVSFYYNCRETANLMLGALNRSLNDSKKTMEELLFTPRQLAALVKMSEDGIVSKNAAKELLALMFESGEDPETLAQKHGMVMEHDPEALAAVIDRIVSENPGCVAEYRAGSQKTFGFLMGQVVRKAGKGVNPKLAKAILSERLK